MGKGTTLFIAALLIAQISTGCSTFADCTKEVGTLSSLASQLHLTIDAVRGFAFDSDDNAFVLPTKIFLFNKVTGEEIGVSTRDFAIDRGLVGTDSIYRTDDGKEHNLKDFEYRNDPVTGSFRDFGDAAHPGKNIFLEHMKWAIEHNPQGFQGPSYNALVKALSTPETAAMAFFITARSHSPENFMEGLIYWQSYMKSQGITVYLPPLGNIFCVGNPHFAGRFTALFAAGRPGSTTAASAASPSEKKVQIMIAILDEIEKMPIGKNAPWILNQDGTGLAQLHTWGFSDDDYGNDSTAIKNLAPLAKRWPHIKITIFATGTNSSHRGEDTIIELNGKWRPQKSTESIYRLN